MKSAIFIKITYFYRLGTFLPPAASPGGLPGGPGMGSHWPTSGIVDFQETAQIVTFIKENSKRHLVCAHRLLIKRSQTGPGPGAGRAGSAPFCSKGVIFVKWSQFY